MAETIIKRISKGEYVEDVNDNSVWVMTTGDTDRDGETVDPEGLDFTEFDLNPVVVDNHQTDGSVTDVVLGKVVRHWLDEVGEGTKWSMVKGPKRTAQMAEIEWNTASAKGREAREMAKAGMLNGGSISFAPLENPKRNRTGGNHYGRAKLLEFTLCPVGSNPSAVRVKSMKFVRKTVTERDGQFFVQFGDGTERGPFPSEDAAMTVHTQPDVSAKAVRKAVVQGKDGWYIHDENGVRVAGPFDTHAEAQAAEPKLRSIRKAEDYAVDIIAQTNAGDSPLDELLLAVPVAMQAAVKALAIKSIAQRGEYAAGPYHCYKEGFEAGQQAVTNPLNVRRNPYMGGAGEQAYTDGFYDGKLGRAMKSNKSHKGINTMTRKCWIQNKSAWLLKSDGDLTNAVLEHLKDMGITDVRMEDDPPPAKSIKKGVREVGKRVIWNGKQGVITDITGDWKFARVKFDDGSVEDIRTTELELAKSIKRKSDTDTGWVDEFATENMDKADPTISEWVEQEMQEPEHKDVDEVVADRADEIVEQGADPDAAVEAAMEEEGVEMSLRKGIKRRAMKMMKRTKGADAGDIVVSGAKIDDGDSTMDTQPQAKATKFVRVVWSGGGWAIQELAVDGKPTFRVARNGKFFGDFDSERSATNAMAEAENNKSIPEGDVDSETQPMKHRKGQKVSIGQRVKSVGEIEDAVENPEKYTKADFERLSKEAGSRGMIEESRELMELARYAEKSISDGDPAQLQPSEKDLTDDEKRLKSELVEDVTEEVKTIVKDAPAGTTATPTVTTEGKMTEGEEDTTETETEAANAAKAMDEEIAMAYGKACQVKRVSKSVARKLYKHVAFAVKARLKSKRKSIDGGDDKLPKGYKFLKDCKDMIESGMTCLHKAEQSDAMNAASQALKCIMRGMKAYGDEFEEKADEDISVNGEEVTTDTGITADTNKRAKRLSKAQANVLDDSIATIDDMGQAADTPKRLKAALLKVAADLTGLMNKAEGTDLDADSSVDKADDGDILSMEDTNKLEKALLDLRGDVSGVMQKATMFTGRRSLNGVV